MKVVIESFYFHRHVINPPPTFFIHRCHILNRPQVTIFSGYPSHINAQQFKGAIGRLEVFWWALVLQTMSATVHIPHINTWMDMGSLLGTKSVSMVTYKSTPTSSVKRPSSITLILTVAHVATSQRIPHPHNFRECRIFCYQQCVVVVCLLWGWGGGGGGGTP